MTKVYILMYDNYTKYKVHLADQNVFIKFKWFEMNSSHLHPQEIL